MRDAMLFNVLSYLSDKLLTEGNAVATLDELYIWLSNMTTIEYIRYPRRGVCLYKCGKCWPGIRTIAAELCLSHSTVKRAS